MTAVDSERRTLTRPPWLDDDLPASPIDLDVLFESGVPQDFLGRMFRVDDEVAMVHSERGAILRFGTTGQSAAVGVVMDTGLVVEVLETPDARELFINSSLRMFVDTVEGVAERFPFYDTDDEEDEVQSASDDVLELVRRIDPPAAEPDRYWSTLVDDMRIGDLTTEAVLEAINEAARTGLDV